MPLVDQGTGHMLSVLCLQHVKATEQSTFRSTSQALASTSRMVNDEPKSAGSNSPARRAQALCAQCVSLPMVRVI